MLSGELSGQPAGSGRSRRAPTRPVEHDAVRPDVLAVLAVLVLAALGLLNLRALGGQSLAQHQALTLAAGVVLFVVLRRFPAASLRWLGWLCYGTSVLLLVAVAVAGTSSNGARRWLTVGSFTLQPSELAKVGLVLVLANVLGAQARWPRRFALSLLLAAVPIALVVIEPDLSTATVLAAMTVALLLLGGIPVVALLLFVAGAAVAAPFAERLLQPYQLERLHAFLNSSQGGSGSGWTILQAHIALAWGGVSGQAGRALHLALADYLPDRETDLAFTSLVEQEGIRAGVLAAVAAAVLVWRLAVASRRARTRPAALAAAGFAALIGIEVSVSVAANLGLIPTAGVPFPLLSYGGTAAAVHIGMVGLVLGLRTEATRHRLWIAPRWRRRHPRLIRLAAVGVSAGLVAMLGYIWNLQQVQGPALRAAGRIQMTRCISVPAVRGLITDRHGTVLAADVPRDKIWVIRGLASSAGLTRVAQALRRSPAALRHTVATSPDAPIVPVGVVSPAAGSRLRGLPGVLVEPDPMRRYPYGSLLGPILGWTGVATPADMRRWPTLPLGAVVGRAGLEQQYDAVLRGTPGTSCVYVDPAGDAVATAPGRTPVAGSSLRLSLDLGLQRHFAAALRAAMQTGADMGAGVVLDPRSGAVLAMVSLPSYDDNVFGPPVDGAAVARVGRRPGLPMLEHATQVEAPPGSTFKLVVASANMRHPVLGPSEVVPTGGSWTLYGHTFHNWSALPPQDLVQAIAWSNDVYFYKLAWSLGADSIVSTARSLDVGRPTGIDLPGEYSGVLGSPASVARAGGTWYPGSTVLLGIGQGYLAVTPLQDAVWTSGVATGAVITPHLGLAVDRPGRASTVVRVAGPRPLPFADRLGPVRAGMRAAATSGTAQMLGTLPVAAGGKTGTAEDATAPGSATDSWLSAVAPLRHPIVEATAFLHGGFGGEAASPPVRAVLAYFLAHEKSILSTASS